MKIEKIQSNKWIKPLIPVFIDFIGKSGLGSSLLAFDSSRTAWIGFLLSFESLFESIYFFTLVITQEKQKNKIFNYQNWF